MHHKYCQRAPDIIVDIQNKSAGSITPWLKFLALKANPDDKPHKNFG